MKWRVRGAEVWVTRTRKMMTMKWTIMTTKKSSERLLRLMMILSKEHKILMIERRSRRERL